MYTRLGYDYKFGIPEPSYDGAASASSSHSTIVTPMPGKIIKVMAKKGDTITADQPLLIMEAMKMEVIYSLLLINFHLTK